MGVLAALLAVLAATAGGAPAGGEVDKGGFSTKNRADAQADLDTLRGTSIPGTIVQLTATIGLPLVCRVHFSADDPKVLQLIMAWKPMARTSGAFTWFKASIRPDGLIPSSLHLGISPSLSDMQAHYGVAYTRPFEPCRIDAYGFLKAVPWVGSYPATGRKRKIR